MRPSRPRVDWGTACVGASGLLVAGYLVLYLGGWGSDTRRSAITDGVYLPLTLAFTALAVRAARQTGLDAGTRRAWRIITAAFVCQVLAHITWFVEEAVLRRTAYPAMADYWFLAFLPLMFAGLLAFPGTGRGRREVIKLALDTLTVGVGTFIVVWYLVLGPTVAAYDTGLLALAVSVALPVGDLLLVLGVSAVLLRRSNPVVEGPVRILAGAVGAFVVADVYYAYVGLHAGFVGGTWPDVCWLVGCFFLVLAADRQYRLAQADEGQAAQRRASAGWLPYGAITLAYGLTAVAASKEGLNPLGGMLVGVFALTLLVIVRQVYALRENRELAVTDPLTGLANRALVTRRVAALVARPLRDGERSAVLLIDLDRFKSVNDAFGHGAGDAILMAVADVLRSVIRDRDTAGRLGGDEFAVVLDTLPSRRVAEHVAERLLTALRTPVVFDGQVIAVEASIGVAIRDSPDQDGDLLLGHADAAMYAAKRAGRGRYMVYTPELDRGARDVELRRAIEAGQLVLHYQPVTDLTDGRTVAVEALVRWQHPTQGLLMPDAFIELAEEKGAILPLGAWVLRSACRQVARWHAEVPAARGLRLNVNLSSRQVALPTLVRDVRAVLDETGFDPRLLVLELVESGILQPDAPTIAKLEELRGMGVRIAVDDFGTGYSALSYLRQLPVNILKIDRSFIVDIADDPEARTVTEAVVRLGRALRLHVVAEGIETVEQVEALRRMDCLFGQGYYFSRPIAGPALVQYLRDERERHLAPLVAGPSA